MGVAVERKLPSPMDAPPLLRTVIQRWIPQSELRGSSWDTAYSTAGHTLYLANGSFLEFLSCDQPSAVHASADRTFVWFDEEVPQAIFTENMARLAESGRQRSWWMAYAPLGEEPRIKERLHDLGARDAKQALVRLVVNKVTVRDHHMAIYFKIPIDASPPRPSVSLPQLASVTPVSTQFALRSTHGFSASNVLDTLDTAATSC